MGFAARDRARSGARPSLIAQKKLDPSPLHTHTFALDQLPDALRYFREKLDGAIKVVIKPQLRGD